jgi:hypothetical protein
MEWHDHPIIIVEDTAMVHMGLRLLIWVSCDTPLGCVGDRATNPPIELRFLGERFPS